MNEEQLENLCLDWFKETGWEVVHGPDIAPDGDNPARGNYSDVLLTDHLPPVFPAINKHIPSEAIGWWKNLPKAPDREDEMLNIIAPFLQSALSKKALLEMDESALYEICMRVHSITDYARRIPNKSVNLPSDGTQYNIPQKVDALAKRIWHDQSSNGERVKRLLGYILHSGSGEQLPERLWQGVTDQHGKLMV